MNSSYNYGNMHTPLLGSDGNDEEYDYYATENLQSYDFEQSSGVDNAIESLMLSGATIRIFQY